MPGLNGAHDWLFVGSLKLTSCCSELHMKSMRERLSSWLKCSIHFWGFRSHRDMKYLHLCKRCKDDLRLPWKIAYESERLTVISNGGRVLREACNFMRISLWITFRQEHTVVTLLTLSRWFRNFVNLQCFSVLFGFTYCSKDAPTMDTLPSPQLFYSAISVDLG